jgi:hypothetical protein
MKLQNWEKKLIVHALRQLISNETDTFLREMIRNLICRYEESIKRVRQ